MEPIVIKDIKTSIIKESIDECYLNPKDNIINEHYTQNCSQNLFMSLLFYLPLNEIIIVILEEKLVIYDLKITLTENLKIIDEIFFIKDIINIFKDNNKVENEKIKTDKNKITNEFRPLSFYDKEFEDKQVINILISDDFYNIKGKFIIIIQFANLDIYLIEYNLLHEINNKPKMSLISKNSKNLFIEKNTVNNIINRFDENAFKNSSKIIIKIIKYSNKNIFIIYQFKNKFYIYDFTINGISQYINEDKSKKKSLSYIKILFNKYEEFNSFDANYCTNSSSNYLEIIANNKCGTINYYLFLIKTNEISNKKYEKIICEEIKLENKMIKAYKTDIKYYKRNINYDELLSEKIFFVIQLNQVFIIKYNIYKDNKKNLRFNICYKYLIDIIEFNEAEIYNIFILQQKYFYAFNRKGIYIEFDLNINQLKNNKNIEVITIKEKIQYFKIAKFIYDIAPFQSENGFFLLVTQYPLRPINMNIIYKVHYSNISPIKYNYFSEGLMLTLRYNKKETILDKENKDFYLFNKRYDYFINKIFKGQNNLLEENKDKMDLEEIDSNNINETDENKNDDLMKINSALYKEKEKQSLIENEKIKKDLILFFQKKFENLKNNELKYINNDKYKCEFCGEKFKEFDKEKMWYKCNNDEITFSCCLSCQPINDDFFWCSYCDLFYSNEMNIFYCIICEKILSKLDSM